MIFSLSSRRHRRRRRKRRVLPVPATGSLSSVHIRFLSLSLFSGRARIHCSASYTTFQTARRRDAGSSLSAASDACPSEPLSFLVLAEKERERVFWMTRRGDPPASSYDDDGGTHTGGMAGGRGRGESSPNLGNFFFPRPVRADRRGFWRFFGTNYRAGVCILVYVGGYVFAGSFGKDCW